MITSIQKRALHRTKILEGQMRGLYKMIEKEEYCVEIITQSLAIQKSLGSLNKLILENHLHTHVKNGLEHGTDKDKQRVIVELLSLYELSNVRSK